MGALHWRERSRLLCLGCVMLSRYLVRLSVVWGDEEVDKLLNTLRLVMEVVVVPPYIRVIIP